MILRRTAGTVSLLWLASAATSSFGGGGIVTTIEALSASKEQLQGQRVAVRGKVVKVNAGILGRTFFHIQDGEGSAHDVPVTTQQNVELGADVVVTGRVTVDRFGAGYSYPVILEDATVAEAGAR